MLSPTTLDLPFKSWRPGQAHAIESILKSQKRFILCQLPTGVGKSVLPMAVQRLLEQKAVVLTSTKSLQQQYLKDFPWAVTMEGRNNYPCIRYPPKLRATAELCNHSKDRPCPRINDCLYKRAKARALSAPVAVLNTSYFLHEANYAGEFTDLEWLWLDEAHMIEAEIMKFIKVEVTGKQLTALNLGTPEFKTKFEAWRDWAQVTLREVERKRDHLEAALGDEASLWNLEDAKEKINLEKLIGKLVFFIHNVDENWVFESGEDKWVFEPVWIDRFAGEAVLRHAKKIVLMSATLPKRETCRVLKLRDEEVEYISSPSPFPIDNRRVFFYPCANMSPKAAEWSKGVEGLDRVLSAYPSYKALVHTHSYVLSSYVLQHSVHASRMVTHNTSSREAVLQKFKEDSRPLVLVSPSMEQGTDLPYDSCRLNLILKVPFQNLDSKQVSARFFRDRKGYQAWACRDIVQASGRSTRAADDWSISYILDSNFGWLYSQCRSIFPPWWREAVQEVTDFRRLECPRKSAQ